MSGGSNGSGGGSSKPVATAAGTSSNGGSAVTDAGMPQPDFNLLCEVFDLVPADHIRSLMTKYSVHETPQHLNALFTEIDACQKEAEALQPNASKHSTTATSAATTATIAAAAAAATVGTSNNKTRGSPTVKPVSAAAPPAAAAPSVVAQTKSSPPSATTSLPVARPVATTKGSKSDGNAGPVYACRLCQQIAPTRDALFAHLYQTGHFVFPAPAAAAATNSNSKPAPVASAAGSGGSETNKSWKSFGTAPAPDTTSSKQAAAPPVRSASVASRHGPVPMTAAAVSPTASPLFGAVSPPTDSTGSGSGGSAVAAAAAAVTKTTGSGGVAPIPAPVEFCYLSRASSSRDTPGYLSHVAPQYEFLESAMITGGVRVILTRHRTTRDLFVTFRGTKTGVNMLFDVLCALHPKKAERSLLRTASPVINHWKATHGPFIRFYTGHSLGGWCAQVVDPLNTDTLRITLNTAFPTAPGPRKVVFLRLKYDPVSGFVFRKGADQIVTTPVPSKGQNMIPHKLSDLIASFQGRSWAQVGRLPDWMAPYVALAVADAKALAGSGSSGGGGSSGSINSSNTNGHGDKKAASGAADAGSPTVTMSDAYASAIAQATRTTGSGARSTPPRTPPLPARTPPKPVDPIERASDADLLTLSMSEFLSSPAPAAAPPHSQQPIASASGSGGVAISTANSTTPPQRPSKSGVSLLPIAMPPPATTIHSPPITVASAPPTLLDAVPPTVESSISASLPVVVRVVAPPAITASDSLIASVATDLKKTTAAATQPLIQSNYF